MAALTWRSVAAPDFSGVQGGISNAGEFFNRGFSGGIRALEGVQATREDNAIRDVLAQAMASDDPDAVRQMAAQATENPNFSLRGVEMLNKQAGNMLESRRNQQIFDIAQHQMDRGLITEGRADRAYDSREAARGALNQALLTGNFDPSNPAFANMNTEDLAGAMADAARARAAGQDVQLNEQRLTQGQMGIANAKAQQEASDFMLNSNWDSQSLEDQQRIFREASGSLSPEARSVIGNRLGLTNPRASGGVGAGLAAAGAANISSDGINNDAYDTVLGYGKYGSPPQKLSTMTIGNAAQFGRDVLIPNSKKAGVGRDSRGLLGSSAMGAYQFTQETLMGKAGKPGLAERTFGAGYQNVLMTPENQDRMAERLFNETKGGNLKSIWASLPDSKPGAYANRSWAEMKPLIVGNELGKRFVNREGSLEQQVSGLDLAGTAARHASLIGASNRAAAGMGATTKVVNDYANDTQTTTADVYSSLLKKMPPLTSYTGADRDMADKINTVKGMGKGITNRMAQAFIENALVPSTGPGWFGSGVDINMAGIRTAIDRYTSGDTDRDLVTAAKRAGGIAAVDAAKARADAAKVRLDAAVAMQAQGIGSASNVAQRQREMVAEGRLYTAAVTQYGNSAAVDKGTRQPRANAPAPSKQPTSTGQPTQGKRVDSSDVDSFVARQQAQRNSSTPRGRSPGWELLRDTVTGIFN